MIPLIDVSLVLLIFFMMTAGPGAASVLIQTPNTENVELEQNPTPSGIGINLNDPKYPIPSYSFGTTKEGTINKNLTQEQCLDRARTAARQAE